MAPGRVCLTVAMESLDVDQLLAELRRRRWVLHFFGADREAPEVIAAVLRWQRCADVVVLRGEDDAVAYRTPTAPRLDVFAPELVYWVYAAPATWTLKAVLSLEPPDSPNAPDELVAAPAGCSVPPEVRGSRTIRPT
jgi:hypothetical protein